MPTTPFSRFFSTQRSKSKHESSSTSKREDKHDNDTEVMPHSHSNTSPPSKPASSPVVIPMRGHHDNLQTDPRHDLRKDRYQARKKFSTTRSRCCPQDPHSANAIPPSVAALLAVTSIPPPKTKTSVRKRADQLLTVDSILQQASVSEKDLSISFGGSPLELLLGPPDENDCTDCSSLENAPGSVLSTRTTSSESVPSLDNTSISEASITSGSFSTPNSRGRRSLPTRRYQPTSPGESALDNHPLLDIDIDELDFRVFERTPDLPKDEQSLSGAEPPHRKSAFKSNLTASLKALRSAAKSFSSLTTPMITPDDFLTRSIVSIDPKVPFTDERMPPLLGDAPTPALRRYLNPTTHAPTEAHVPTAFVQTMSATSCTASIQMQTYKVSKTRRSSSPNIINRRLQRSSEDAFTEVGTGPVARQREMRENSDFIRIAVMEMAMRRNGKLDDHKPGRARWALPPRKVSTKAYQIGDDGVPVRWALVTD